MYVYCMYIVYCMKSFLICQINVLHCIHWISNIQKSHSPHLYGKPQKNIFSMFKSIMRTRILFTRIRCIVRLIRSLIVQTFNSSEDNFRFRTPEIESVLRIRLILILIRTRICESVSFWSWSGQESANPFHFDLDPDQNSRIRFVKYSGSGYNLNSKLEKKLKLFFNSI